MGVTVCYTQPSDCDIMHVGLVQCIKERVGVQMQNI